MKPLAKRRRDAERDAFPQARREVRALRPTVHGAPDFDELRRLGLCSGEVLDFSANINPYGPSPSVRQTLATAAIDQYPDRKCLLLNKALADHHRIAPPRVLSGNGSTELIGLAALAFLPPRGRALVIGPTFSEYSRAATIMGARVSFARACEENDFVPAPAEIEKTLAALRPQLVFVCNPNNPTGAVLTADVLAFWARQFPRTLFVIDEAYLPFAAGLDSALPFAEGNLVVLRSMTKDFGLAGLRLGYVVGDARTIEILHRVQPPWSVNALAQAAGIAALGDLAHRQLTLERLAGASKELAAGLSRLGFVSLPSATPFFLLRVGDGAAFREALLRRGMLVRDCASFGLPAYVRISPRRPEENERLLTTIQEVIR